MKTMKRFLALMLVLTLVCFSLPIKTDALGFDHTFLDDDDNPRGPYAQSIYMYSEDNQQCVYELNSDVQRPMASLTKIMTYIVAYDCISLLGDVNTTVITVPQVVEEELEGTGSSLAGIYVGEELTAKQLLELMMIPSGNDAALTLAVWVDNHREEIEARRQQAAIEKAVSDDDEEESLSEEDDIAIKDIPDPIAVNELDLDGIYESYEEGEGNEDGESSAVSYASQYFVSLMNEKARELGCLDTHFVNPHGLHDPNHYSTARDLQKIVECAVAKPYFSEIVDSTEVTIPPTNICDWERSMEATNRMLLWYADDGYYYYDFCNGIKTGSHNEAGYCIVSRAVYNGYTYVVVAMGCPMIDENGDQLEFHGEMKDAEDLFEWAFKNLKFVNITEAGDIISEVKVDYAWNKDRVQAVAAENVQIIMPRDVDTSSLLSSVALPEKVQAPVKKGDYLGTIEYSYSEAKVASVDLIAGESIERSQIIQTIETGRQAIKSPIIFLAIALFIIAIIIYIIIANIHSRQKKRNRRANRYRNI